ncbi:hypothetical protein GJAV_G00256060 [Gymnothorax javanicus]|nr:hypothetical protein GJAV_G00256060 [Gymnothorax javanicus]
MLYCCGSTEGDSANGEKAIGKQLSEGESTSARIQPEMYGMSGIPDLLPPASSIQPAAVHEQNVGNGQLSFDSPQRRQRAPKLGQIGRSKRVVIEDEDLDDVLNNNGQFSIPITLSPVT